MKNKFTTILIIVATLILAGVAVFTSIRLFQLRKESVTPTKPESEPEAQVQPTTPSGEFCIGNLDLILIMDASGSMTQDDGGVQKIEKAKAAALAFVNKIEQSEKGGPVRLGVVSYGRHPSSVSKVEQELTTNYSLVKNAINGLSHDLVGAHTCIECALTTANTELADKKTTGIKQYAILLTDGIANRTIKYTYEQLKTVVCVKNNGDIIPGCTLATALEAAVDAGNKGHNAGITYYTIRYGTEEPTGRSISIALTTIAGSPSRYYFEPDSSKWIEIYLGIAKEICEGPTPSPSATATASPLACTALTFNISGKTATPTPTATPTITATPTVTNTPTGTPNSCGGTCGSNTNCQSAYYCYQGYCRNPSCPTDTDCVCSAASCNNSCSQNSDCATSLVCSSGSCRNPSCTSDTDCTCPTVTPRPTTSPEPTLPNAGVGTPTIFGLGGGLLLLIISLALVL